MPSLNAERPIIIALVEPRTILPDLYTHIEKHAASYDLILTFSPTLLQFPNARQLLFGTSWVTPVRANHPTPLAEKGGVSGCTVSMLCGDKLATQGHKIRRALYMNQTRLESNSGRGIYAYRSSRGLRLPTASKRRQNPLYIPHTKDQLHVPFLFSIVVENSDEPGYFSEKLLDCLLCNTIPVYWGTSSVETLFNPKGILRLQGSTPEEVVQSAEQILQSCTLETYRSLAQQGVLEENRQRALAYAFNFSDRMVEGITSWQKEHSK